MLPFSNEIFTRKLFTIPLLPSHPLPCPREAHIWYIAPHEVKCASLLNQYFRILSPNERHAVLSLNGANLQKSALLARTLVRTTLSRYIQSKIPPQLLRFSKNAFGKPQLVWQHKDGHENGWNPPCLHFNISHTSSLVACAVTVDLEVGIDVEDRKRKLKHNVLSFARRFFSPNEVEFLLGLPDPVMQQEFIKLWTLKVFLRRIILSETDGDIDFLKFLPRSFFFVNIGSAGVVEAYVKALGRGFSSAPFRNFTVRHQAKDGMRIFESPSFNASRITVEVHSDFENLTESWQFALFELSTHYTAVCIQKAGEKEGCDVNDSLRLKVWRTIPFIEDEEDECIL